MNVFDNFININKNFWFCKISINKLNKTSQFIKLLKFNI